MSDFGMSNFVNNQQATSNGYNIGVLEHNKELQDHLTDQIQKFKGNMKSDKIADVLTHGKDTAKELYLSSELSEAVKNYGKYKTDYKVSSVGHLTANKNYLTQQGKEQRAKTKTIGEEEPDDSHNNLTNDTGVEEPTELDDFSDRSAVHSVPEPPEEDTEPESVSAHVEDDENGETGDTGVDNPVHEDELPQARMSSTSGGAGNGVGDVDAGESGARGSVVSRVSGAIKGKVSDVTGVSKEGLDVGMYGAKKLIGTGLALTSTISDIKSGHLQGDNIEENIGDVGMQVGGALDLIGTFVRVLEPVGAAISVASGLLTGIGHIVDDFHHKPPDIKKETATLQGKINAQKISATSSNNYQQMGLVSSMSKNPNTNIGSTSVF